MSSISALFNGSSKKHTRKFGRPEWFEQSNTNYNMPNAQSMEQEAARRAMEQETLRVAQEQEALRIAQEQEAARRTAEQEAARIARQSASNIKIARAAASKPPHLNSVFSFMGVLKSEGEKKSKGGYTQRKKRKHRKQTKHRKQSKHRNYRK
jgi:hypothetical protein